MFDYNEIISARKRFTDYDKEILDGNRKLESLDELESDFPTGRFSIDLKAWHFECLFYDGYGEDLYVIYSGARGRGPVPHFPRWTYYRMFSGGMLCIEDPMYYKYPNLGWGVFYGDRDESCIEVSLSIIKKVCVVKKFKRVIFFSSSGGGYASIYAASCLHNSLSVSINPQLYIQDWGDAMWFKKITGIDLSTQDDLDRNNVAKKIRSGTSKHLLIMNCQDDSSLESQFLPFYDELRVLPKYGLVEKDNVLLWLYDCKGSPDPHIAWETKNIFLFVDYIAKNFYENKLTEQDYQMVLWINECWHDLYQIKSELYYNLKKINETINPNIFLVESHGEDYIDDVDVHRIQNINITKKYKKFTVASLRNRYVIYSVFLRIREMDACDAVVGIYDYSNHNWLIKKNGNLSNGVNFTFAIGDNKSYLALCVDEKDSFVEKECLLFEEVVMKVDRLEPNKDNC